MMAWIIIKRKHGKHKKETSLETIQGTMSLYQSDGLTKRHPYEERAVN